MRYDDTYSKLRSQRAWRSARTAQCVDKERGSACTARGGRIGAHGKRCSGAKTTHVWVGAGRNLDGHNTAVLNYLWQEIRGRARDVCPVYR